ncbi:MAG: DUF2155 domain-containing protein [Oceanicaulis sp.]|jgi:hypothetical protein|uniref:DUF2155 domain-containing protein n=1 Tax=unclassified Oceanicaulis TaxID=2632123 RepID=UPI000066D531|nr:MULTISPECIES: DUF2155 domain-containing protein [unclassified Oceanicaulis]EAP91179.1 hypothetical protein OA2633_03356 [Oceanicaulis sp. HTCC2633]MBC39200.1 DUF2155 domain-containing protein [Oceanicaulis sp.]MBG37279.1 DUF2155 domain-containing protein [Oceanicaulis sp.]HBU62593.1 DUF2155 domain-containing protein [Oceanicaulis sp.]|tara:strand:- start:2303 stop:2776 length:474 start_codon:yes stop_codon:yes gene_type:complete
MTMIRTLFLTAATAFSVASLASASLFAQSAEAPEQAPSGLQALEDPEAPELTSEPGSVVVLRGLDKVTARTRDFEAPIGEEVRFGALSITVPYCRKRPPEEPPEVYAFLEIEDRRTDGFGVQAEGELMFSGWMFASNPALNALEHPVYDVWVIDCRS